MSDPNTTNSSKDPAKDSALSLESLADEIEGKETTSGDRFAGLLSMAGEKSSNLGTAGADLTLFGAKLAADLKVDLGGGVGKIHHKNGDLTIFTEQCSYTQTVKQGGFYRVRTESGEVVFHLRPDGDIDLLAPEFDATLRRVSAGGGVFFWTNAEGTIKITLDELTGFSTSIVAKPKQ